MVDLRVHDINVVADLMRHDPNAPDPDTQQPLDGTADGRRESQTIKTQAYAEARLQEATDLISVYWSGWWPTVHFEVQHEFVTDVMVSIHITVDILGSVNIVGFDIKFLGLEDMSEAEGDALVDSIRPLSESAGLAGPDDPWFYFFKLATISYIAAGAIAAFASPGSVYAEVAFWIAIGMFIALTLLGLITLADAVAKGIADPVRAAMTFLTIALTSLLAIGMSKMLIDQWDVKSEGAAKYFRFFRERYQQGEQWEKRGFKGRTYFGFMFAQLVVLLTIVLLAVGFFLGWIYQWFVGT